MIMMASASGDAYYLEVDNEENALRNAINYRQERKDKDE